MNAQEARAKTTSNIQNEVDGQYRTVKSEIEKAVSCKNYEATHYGILREEVVRLLKEEGFTVMSRSGRPGDDCDTIISW